MELFKEILSIRKILNCKCFPSNVVIISKITSVKHQFIISEFLKLLKQNFHYDKINFYIEITHPNDEYLSYANYYKYPPNVKCLNILSWSRFDTIILSSTSIETVGLFDYNSSKTIDTFPPSLKNFTCDFSSYKCIDVHIDPRKLPYTIESLQIGSKVIPDNGGYTLPNLKSLKINNDNANTRVFFDIQNLSELAALSLSRIPFFVQTLGRLKNLQHFELIDYRIPPYVLNLPSTLEYLYFIKCEGIDLRRILFPESLRELMIPPVNKKKLLKSNIPSSLRNLYFDTNYDDKCIQSLFRQIKTNVSFSSKKDELKSKKYLSFLRNKRK